MKRKTRRVAVISLVVAALAMILVFWRQQPSTHGEPGAASIEDGQPRVPAGSEPQSPAGPARDANGDDGGNVQADESAGAESRSDPEADLEWLREVTTSEVLVTYSLMFRHLGLTASEQRDLSVYLVEAWMSATRTPDHDPEPVAEGDRRARIAAIIGDAKLEQLLDLERNRAEYGEAGQVSALLETNDLPLTVEQQDRFLEILIQVRGQDQAVADPNPAGASIEAIEHQMALMDEYERLVLELAPSVLSARQVELLFDRYQAFSYRRAAILELQKKTRANDNSEDDFPLGYPARN